MGPIYDVLALSNHCPRSFGFHFQVNETITVSDVVPSGPENISTMRMNSRSPMGTFHPTLPPILSAYGSQFADSAFPFSNSSRSTWCYGRRFESQTLMTWLFENV